jgi:hypothetical protein
VSYYFNADVDARAHRKATKQPKLPPKPQRNKFQVLDSPNMPNTIPNWARALSEVDRTQPIVSSAPNNSVYVFPEPAIIVSAGDEARIQLHLHHYQMMREALLYALAEPQPPDPFTPQQWRDVLAGKVTGQGQPGSLAASRASAIARVLGPAMRACGIEPADHFPARRVLPTTALKARELLWEAAEINFRYELYSVDERASGLSRPEDCRKCFAGGIVSDLNLTLSKQGLAAISFTERLPHLLSLARLMHDWHPRPNATILYAGNRNEWTEGQIEDLEYEVARHYTQTFYQLLGRAAVIPMRLEHEFAGHGTEAEDGGKGEDQDMHDAGEDGELEEGELVENGDFTSGR